MFRKVLVANRGAVARRIIRALREMNIASVAVYSEADAGAPYLAEADESRLIGGPKPASSYLNVPRMLKVLSETGADAVHPGYGFLAESAEFSAAVRAAGATFIGPSEQWLTAMGHKTRARTLMAEHGLATGLGTEVLESDEQFLTAASDLGYPVMVKPASGGGGIGMLVAEDADALLAAVRQGRTLSERAFGSAELYLERFIAQPRHVEFQILADGNGAAHVFERDCSIQRRHQKVIEESPAPGLDRATVSALADEIVGALGTMGYDNIGTVEMLRAPDGGFGFLETNTRLQVEHGVTEMATGFDIVQAQIRLAAGASLKEVMPEPATITGHAIEARVYAEDPKRFYPSPGLLTRYRPPAESANVRVDTGFAEGQRVTPFYDPMLAKVIVRGDDRAGAIAQLQSALAAFEIEGVKNNIPALQQVLVDARFVAGDVHTGLLGDIVAGQ